MSVVLIEHYTKISVLKFDSSSWPITDYVVSHPVALKVLQVSIVYNHKMRVGLFVGLARTTPQPYLAIELFSKATGVGYL